jgi:hypothetical protein
MPQLLHFLTVDGGGDAGAGGAGSKKLSEFNSHYDGKSDISRKTLDFGTLAVFSCPNSCSPGQSYFEEHGAYVEECVWVQPPIGFDYVPKKPDDDGDEDDDSDDEDGPA